MTDRDLQQLFARVCRDSGWELDYVRAAILVAKIAGRTPLEVWLALGSDDLMKRLASGELCPPLTPDDQGPLPTEADIPIGFG